MRLLTSPKMDICDTKVRFNVYVINQVCNFRKHVCIKLHLACKNFSVQKKKLRATCKNRTYLTHTPNWRKSICFPRQMYPLRNLLHDLRKIQTETYNILHRFKDKECAEVFWVEQEKRKLNGGNLDCFKYIGNWDKKGPKTYLIGRQTFSK